MPRFPALPSRLLVVLLFSTVAAAQGGKTMAQGDITGQVRLPNDVPAPVGTIVVLDRTDSGFVSQTNTDSQGKFQFRGLDPMPYRVTVRLRGYETSQTDVDLQFIAHTYVQIKLRPVPGMQGKAPAPGAGEVISARDAQIPAAAITEFDKGKKELVEHNNAGKAIPHFTKAIQIYDKFSQAYLLLGIAYSAQNKLPEASSALNKAVESDPKFVPAYVALGSLQDAQKDYGGAEKSLLKAVELDPESVDAHLELARTYWATGRWQEADPHAAKVLMLRPDNPGGHVIMGNVLLRKRENTAALKEFQEALRLAPESPLAPSIREVVKKIEAATKSSKE